ncbi:hypothetical protein ACFL7M_05120 [Thermodesulfobacteriota bacterium]
METNKAYREYEVLSPWADVDPRPLRGVSARVADLEGKKIGLFHNSKRAARPILATVEKKLKERFPSLDFSRFELMPNAGVDETGDKDRFDEWIKGIDAVVLSYGD